MPTKHKRPVRKRPTNTQPPTLLILAGVGLLLIAIFALKSGDSAPTEALLEAQLDQALRDGHPTFVLLHSLDCIPCKEMMNVVAEVYPEFQESVVLIDVDVYDQRNTNLLRREGLQSIPTLVFYDQTVNHQVYVGVLEALQLRQTLAELTRDQ